MNDGTLVRRLLTHIALRLVAATALLGSALLVQLRLPGAFDVNPFYFLVAFVYAASLAFIVSLRFVERHGWLVDLHLAIDILVVSAAVILTGGISSVFTSLYALPIVAASTLQFRRGALQVAALASLVYAGIVLAQYAEAPRLLIPYMGLTMGAVLPPAGVAQYTVAFNVAGFFAVAFLAGALAERMRHTSARLEQASEALADLQVFSQYVIDNLVSGLATADEDDRLLTFNPSAVQITGHRLASVVGRPAVDTLQLPAAFVETLDEELRRARSKRTTLQYRRPDDRIIDLALSAAQLPLPSGRRGYLYAFEDVTELTRLQRTAEIQTRLAAVGEMAAGIAHEIRNPLAAMSGSLQLLRQELSLTRGQAHLMDIVLGESERLNQTIQSFLSYARPQRVQVEQLDLRTAVQETATLLQNSTEIREGHAIDVDVPPDEVPVEADEQHVRQIVWNLATNGLRAMPEGGTLRLRVSSDLADGVSSAVLSVTDEGTGIADEDLQGLFQPFHGSFEQGTGLGLAIVQRIVTDYEARVDVQSQPGRGTTFRVTFRPVRGPRPHRSREPRRRIS